MTQKEKTLVSNIVFLFVIVITLCFLILVSINNGKYDLLISQSVVTIESGTRYSSSIFGQFFEIFGVLPIYLLIPFVLMGLFYFFKTSENMKKKLQMILLIIIAVVSVGAFVYGEYHMIKITYQMYNGDAKHWVWTSMISLELLFTIPLSALLSWGYYLLWKKINPERSQLLRFCIVSIIVMGASFGLVQLIKALASRNRYRAMMYLFGNTDRFTPWYIKGEKSLELENAIKDDFKSFPSGHSQSATTFLLISLLPIYFKKLNTKFIKVLGYIIAPLFVLLTMAARVVMGAHFTSDVLVGFGITFTLIFVVYFTERRIYYKKVKDNA